MVVGMPWLQPSCRERRVGYIGFCTLTDISVAGVLAEVQQYITWIRRGALDSFSSRIASIYVVLLYT